LTSIVAGSADAVVYHTAPRLGCRAVLADRFEPEQAAPLLSRERVTGTTVVPTMLARLAELDVQPGAFRDLRFFVSHRAALPTEHARRVEEHFGAAIVQAYGSSDSGGIAASHVGDAPELRWSTVGKLLDGTELRLLDEHGHDVAPGQVGRLTVRGAHALGGYFRQADKTTEAWRLPLHSSTLDALVGYLQRRDELHPHRNAPSLFISPAGTRLLYCNVHWTFLRLVQEAGLTPRSTACRPRPHDLRHSFAVKTILDAYRTNADVAARLPLPTYLGHVSPAHTYWYLSAAPELLALAGQRLERSLAEGQ